jgi:bacillithiol biosynthesis deacetylase BshB1
MRDGFFANDAAHQLQVIQVIRKYQPEIVLCNAIDDRHPDHARAASLVREASFLAGLSKVETVLDGKVQLAWRPRKVMHYIQDKELKPDILVDISGYLDKKWEAIQAYTSQFYNPESDETPTYISTPEFLEALRGRHLIYGKYIGVLHAEGFTTSQYLGVRLLNDLL